MTHVTSLHCSLHQYTLAFKTLPPRLMEVNQHCGQSDQLYSFKSKKSLALPTLAKEMGAQHEALLLYTKVHWLSIGRCLHQLYKLRNEIKVFLQENKANLHVQFHNKEFIMMLAYLAGVFGHFNKMNLSLQGHNITTKISW